MAGTGECVKVIVRCRPMNTRENDLKCKNVLNMISDTGLCTIINPNDVKAPPKSFTFDGSYFVNSTTEAIYNEIAYPLVEGVTEGYNGTIFAYGQTGCGKSFTMQGITDPASQRGIIPRAFDHVFETVSVAEHTKFLIHASYCEIYNEEIRDLLGKDIKARLELHEHPEKGVYVNGLSQHAVHNVVECNKIMDKGWKNRSTGSTLMNADSSRSHSIFTINLEMMTPDDEGEEHIRAGKLNLVDLAGSERQAKTGATGDRLKEATKINLSLSALGNVISALVDGKSKHIPYRDSKLTRLLQDSLGGNTKTLMVACLSPADNNYDETLSTLRYANRAKNIKNKPKINEDPKDALLRQYQEEIERLKAMLMGQIPLPEGGFQGVLSIDAGSKSASKSRQEESDRIELEEEKRKLKEEYDRKLEEMQMQYEQEKVGKARLEQDISKLRAFYDSKISNLDGQIEKLPSTAEAEEIISQGDKKGTRKSAAVVAVKGPDGKPLKDAQGKVITKKDVRTDENDEGLERPTSVMGEVLPPGPEIEDNEDVYQNQNREDVDDDRLLDMNGMGYEVQPAVSSIAAQSLAKQSGEESMITSGSSSEILALLPGEEEHVPGLLAPRSSPTHDSMQNQLRFQQNEALKRLHELEQQMVGGENKENKELKEKRKKKITFAEERKRKLAEAVTKNDEKIMLQIYDNIGDELRSKNQLLEKEKEKNESLNREILDIQSEFEFERIDYLDTIRKQDRQLMLLQEIIDHVQPCVRKDCNYSNLDRIKMMAKWDDNTQKWMMPQLKIEKTALPVTGTTLPGGVSGSRSPKLLNGEYDDYEDKYRDKIMKTQDRSGQYFQTKRPSQLVSEPLNKVDISEVKKSYNIQPQTTLPLTNGYSRNSLVAKDEPISKELMAAKVHGQIMNDEGVLRKPARLQAINPVARKEKKKKRNSYDEM